MASRPISNIQFQQVFQLSSWCCRPACWPRLWCHLATRSCNSWFFADSLQILCRWFSRFPFSTSWLFVYPPPPPPPPPPPLLPPLLPPPLLLLPAPFPPLKKKNETAKQNITNPINKNNIFFLFRPYTTPPCRQFRPIPANSGQFRSICQFSKCADSTKTRKWMINDDYYHYCNSFDFPFISLRIRFGWACTAGMRMGDLANAF